MPLSLRFGIWDTPSRTKSLLLYIWWFGKAGEVGGGKEEKRTASIYRERNLALHCYKSAPPSKPLIWAIPLSGLKPKDTSFKQSDCQVAQCAINHSQHLFFHVLWAMGFSRHFLNTSSFAWMLCASTWAALSWLRRTELSFPLLADGKWFTQQAAKDKKATSWDVVAVLLIPLL